MRSARQARAGSLSSSPRIARWTPGVGQRLGLGVLDQVAGQVDLGARRGHEAGGNEREQHEHPEHGDECQAALRGPALTSGLALGCVRIMS